LTGGENIGGARFAASPSGVGSVAVPVLRGRVAPLPTGHRAECRNPCVGLGSREVAGREGNHPLPLASDVKRGGL
jgi:hypothetical protein